MAVTGYENLDYRWRQGFVNAAQLTATYNLVDFARVADMSGYAWLRPEGSNIYNQAAVMENTLRGGAKYVGRPFFRWRLPRLTPLMTDFILYDATMFNGEAEMDSTVSTWNGARDRWEVVWAIATANIIETAGQTGFYHGFAALNVDFTVLQDAP